MWHSCRYNERFFYEGKQTAVYLCRIEIEVEVDSQHRLLKIGDHGKSSAEVSHFSRFGPRKDSKIRREECWRHLMWTERQGLDD